MADDFSNRKLVDKCNSFFQEGRNLYFAVFLLKVQQQMAMHRVFSLSIVCQCFCVDLVRMV